MPLHADPKAANEGFRDGYQGKKNACPYRTGTVEAWSYHSGWIEGEARRQNGPRLEPVEIIDPPAPDEQA